MNLRTSNFITTQPPLTCYAALRCLLFIAMADQNIDKQAVVALLNEILETELAGVVRYTHYSLMVFGHSRIPIVSLLRGEATVCLAHANDDRNAAVAKD